MTLRFLMLHHSAYQKSNGKNDDKNFKPGRISINIRELDQ